MTTLSPVSSRILGVQLTPDSFRYFLWGLQVAFWALWATLGYNTESAQRSAQGPFVFIVSHVPLMMFVVYFNYFVLIPRYLAKQRLGSYLVILFLLLVVIQGLRLAIEMYVLREEFDQMTRWNMALALSLLLIIGSILFKFVEGWFQVSQQQVHWQNEQLRSELRFLRAQVNPHFLFNTLNNLYSLTLTHDQRAPQMVAKLSDLMRYLIYDSSTTRVKLLRELDLLRSYIDLQQLQYDTEKNVDLYIEGVKNQHQIAPLLLISFLENSFKHGDLATNSQGWISVSAVVEDDHRLVMCFANSIRPHATTQAHVGGIGLDNARRQLELNYPDRHQLHITHGESEFRVELEIEELPLEPSSWR